MKQSTYFKAFRSDEALELMKRPNEYMLLSQIASRAKRTSSFCVHGLEPGEALIGDYKSIGLTQQKYRTAKKYLENWKFITTKATNKGTVAKLINSTIFDINVEATNEQNNETATNGQRTGNERVTTNKNDKKEKKEKKLSPSGVHFKNNMGSYLDATLDLCKQINKYRQKGRPFNPFQWIQEKANMNGHPKAIYESLEWLITCLDKGEVVETFYGFVEATFKTKNPKHNARDAEAESEAFKNVVIENEEIKRLIEGF